MIWNKIFCGSSALALWAFPLYSAPNVKHCLFGSDLVETARYGDLSASEETTIKADQPVSAELAAKIRNAMGEPANSTTSLQELAGPSKQFWLRTLTYKPTGKVYDLIISDPGDNISGGFISGKQRVAMVGDGDIHYCKVAFDPSNNKLFKKFPVQDSQNNSSYFGSNLAELERIAQFTIQVITPKLRKCHSNNECQAMSASLVIKDKFTKQSYYLIVDKKGNGQIISSQSPYFTVGKIENGSISSEGVTFDFYDKLPWFYTN